MLPVILCILLLMLVQIDILLSVKKDFTVESCSTNLYIHVNNNDKDFFF